MTNIILQEINTRGLKKNPSIEPGMTVRVHQKIREGEKERIQVFEGLVIKISHGQGVNKTFTVRKVVEGIGVEKVFPFHSPNVQKIEVKKKSKIRRAKLYYMRDRFGKSARLKGRFLTNEEKEKEVQLEASAAELAEQVEKEEAAKAKEENSAVAEEQTPPDSEEK